MATFATVVGQPDRPMDRAWFGLMGEILFLIHRIPWPPDRGDKIRSHWMLRKLASIAPVHVGCFADDDRDGAYVSQLETISLSAHVEWRTKPMWRAGMEALATAKPVSLTSFHSASMARWVARTLDQHPIDRIVVFSEQMAQYVPPDFSGRFVMDFVDVDSAKFESYAGQGLWPMRWINRREGRVLSRFEAQVARRADACLFVSDAEAAFFQQRSGVAADKVLSMGNGIDTVFYDPHSLEIVPIKRAATGSLLVFTGQMDYRPNVEAVCNFAQRILPEIRLRHGNAQFAIVGRNPVQAVKQLARIPGVLVTGAVDDVRSWLQAADVVVAPLRIARGIQNKVLEAMAMARPVVLSAAAAEGIRARDGEHFHICPTPQDEASAVCALLDDPQRGDAMGKAARIHVQSHYEWNAQLAILDQLLNAKNPILVAAA